jgi:hypothetical protein
VEDTSAVSIVREEAFDVLAFSPCVRWHAEKRVGISGGVAG